MKKAVGAVALALVLGAGVPATASAAVPAHYRTHVVARTTGVEIARQMLAHVQDVRLGASAATITVGAPGHTHPVRVDFGELSRGTAGSDMSGLLTLALLPAAATAFLRTIRLLASLSR